MVLCHSRPGGMLVRGSGSPWRQDPACQLPTPDPMNPEPTVRTRLSVTLALATALLLTSCGGDSDDAGGGSGSGSADVLRVATEGTYAPFSFHDPSSNELTGYDVEVAEAVGAELGMEVEFSETQFDAIFAGLEADRYDVIANQVTVNPEREEKYLFSAPYTVSTGVVITRADDNSVTSIADVKGKRSAQSTTSSFAEVATEAGAQIEAVEGFTQAITLLKQERVDVTINDSLAFLEYQKSTGDEEVKIAAEIDQPSRQALVFRKDSADLQARGDEALTALRADGTLARISEKYFGEDVSGE
jgi:L-cystine transport system substrate-binding protein